jgi:hypothetical protein
MRRSFRHIKHFVRAPGHHAICGARLDEHRLCGGDLAANPVK